MAIDPILYIALGAGIGLGRFLPHPRPWISHATVVAIVALVGALGTALSMVPTNALLGSIPQALLFVAILVALTLAIEQLWSRAARPAAQRVAVVPRGSPLRQFWLPPVLIVALVIGFAAGRRQPLPSGEMISIALYGLLFLVGFDLPLRWAPLRRVAIPTLSCGIGAVAAAVLVSALFGWPIGWTLATSLAFGWYSLSGPLLAQAAGPTAGLLGFLTNFFRENVTMVGAPFLGARLGGEGLTTLGGATSMDTTLYFVTRYGDPDAGMLALMSGLLLTLSASVLVPLVLALAR
ncbi:MAG TPA: lysine exporter LysO family protein [Thermoplasmata archaeon]|nr:lysine exporter LysO family protein [Thermoplasmata archaeon]